MLRNRAWRTPFGGSGPDLAAAGDPGATGGPFDFSNVNTRNFKPADIFGLGDDTKAGGFPPGLVMPLAVGAAGLGLLLLLTPDGGRRGR
jgi:hypothetical protein